MISVINKTFELVTVTRPERNFFKENLSENFSIRFLPGRVCQLFVRESETTPSVFISAEWEIQQEGIENRLILYFNDEPACFYHKIVYKEDKLFFELELSGNRYIFSESIPEAIPDSSSEKKSNQAASQP